ncbi:MAG: sulfatase-modifying factor protein [Chitinophagaceae bacterium]|nr:sulfatase-modifying factor protein [Chitinophagaceae bacterium]
MMAKIESSLKGLVNELMIKVPGGDIELRDDRIKQQWNVELSSFYIAKFPVTQDFYFEVIKEQPSTFTGGQRPVENVTWKEAILFCNALSERLTLKPCYIFPPDNDEVVFNSKADGFRLPTEAEWQFACQAGTKGIRYGELDKIAWYKSNSQNSTQNVGDKEPNSFGLYDMLGNTWEWCHDIYDKTVYGSYRIFRGGGWCDEERSVMATTRRRSHPSTFKIDDLGFRIVRNYD